MTMKKKSSHINKSPIVAYWRTIRLEIVDRRSVRLVRIAPPVSLSEVKFWTGAGVNSSGRKGVR